MTDTTEKAGNDWVRNLDAGTGSNTGSGSVSAGENIVGGDIEELGKQQQNISIQLDGFNNLCDQNDAILASIERLSKMHDRDRDITLQHVELLAETRAMQKSLGERVDGFARRSLTMNNNLRLETDKKLREISASIKVQNVRIAHFEKYEMRIEDIEKRQVKIEQTVYGGGGEKGLVTHRDTSARQYVRPAVALNYVINIILSIIAFLHGLWHSNG